MLAAADTFRAAAVEQLEVWAIRNQLEVISQETGADPELSLLMHMHQLNPKI